MSMRNGLTLLSRLLHSSTGGSLILFVGSATAMLLSVLALPWLTRHYAPAAFGNLAVFVALVSALAPVSTLRLELAIGRHRQADQALTVWAMAMVSTIGLSLLFAVPCLLIAGGLGATHMAALDPRIFLFVPAGIFVGAALNATGYWLTHRGIFVAQASITVATAVTRIALQLGFAVLAVLAMSGLVVGALLAQVLAWVALAVLVIISAGPLRVARVLDLKRMRALLRRHAALPRHSLSTTFINGVASNLLPVVLALKFGPHVAGVLFLAQQLVGTPLSLLVQATWRVSHVALSQPGQDRVQQAFHIGRLHDRYTLLLTSLIAVPVVLAPEAPMLLGPAWADVGVIMPFLGAMVLMNTLSNVTSYFVVFRQYRAEVRWNAIAVVSKIGAILLLAVSGLGPLQVIAGYCLVNILIYVALNHFWGGVLAMRTRFALNLLLFALPALVGAAILAGMPWPPSWRLAALCSVLGLLALVWASSRRIPTHSP